MMNDTHEVVLAVGLQLVSMQQSDSSLGGRQPRPKESARDQRQTKAAVRANVCITTAC